MKLNYMSGIVALLLAASSAPSQLNQPQITVYKDRSCGCCKKWVAHLEASGFKTIVKEVDATAPYQKQFHVPAELGSCHTAVVDGYTIEGHVPAREIKKLLSERPKVVGLSVPGMPIGSPGMENGDRRQAYSVLTFDKSGKSKVYASYAAR
jgi:hypothetical protein